MSGAVPAGPPARASGSAQVAAPPVRGHSLRAELPGRQRGDRELLAGTEDGEEREAPPLRGRPTGPLGSLSFPFAPPRRETPTPPVSPRGVKEPSPFTVSPSREGEAAIGALAEI